MTETKRTATEIRAYCEAATKGPWEAEAKGDCFWLIGGALGAHLLHFELPEERIEARREATFCANARTDLPRVLEAAVKLRTVLAEEFKVCIANLGDMVTGCSLCDRCGDCPYEHVLPLLAETAWLAEGGEESEG